MRVSSHLTPTPLRLGVTAPSRADCRDTRTCFSRSSIRALLPSTVWVQQGYDVDSSIPVVTDYADGCWLPVLRADDLPKIHTLFVALLDGRVVVGGSTRACELIGQRLWIGMSELAST